MALRVRAAVTAVVLALLLATAPFAPAPAAAQSSMWVSGFYAGWTAGQYPPSAIDFSSLTHVMVFSVLPRTDGTLDTTMFMGATTGPAMARDVATRAHAAGRTAVLAVGGGGYVEGFRGATSSANIDRFVANLVAVVDNWGYDGIDLDWEPIAATDHAPILSLVSKLRAARPAMTITVDVGWRNANFAMTTAEKTFYAQLGAAADQVNMMNYGMADAWSGWVSWHSSAVRGHASNRPSSVASSAEQYIAAGVPAAKLGLGIGFYGSCWNAPVSAPLQAPSGARVVATPDYATVMRSYHSTAAYRYDTTADAPYLSFATATGPSGCTFLSYEDERSIAAKADYAAGRGLGGTIIWQLAGGYRAGTTDPGGLLRAVGNAFLGTTPRAATATTLGATPTSAVAGQPVTLTATVTTAEGTPGGTVTFRDGTTVLGTGTLDAGQATLTTALPVGTRSVTAGYDGDAAHTASTSAAVTVTVAKAATTTALTTSRNPSPVRKNVTFTATVAAVAPGAGTPTGPVRFYDGTTLLGTVSLTSGRATFSTSKLAVGSHAVRATYGGSTAYTASNSATITQTVA